MGNALNRLHLGCGSSHLDGYCNIDMIKTEATDVVGNIVILGQFNANSVHQILSEHALEHLSFRRAEMALTRWFELLMPGGELIVETPDMLETCSEFCRYAGRLDLMPEDELSRYPTLVRLRRNRNWGIYKNWGRMRNIYGSQSDLGSFHKSGWWKERLHEVCSSIGYVAISIQRSVECSSVTEREKRFSYHVNEEPCVRVTAYKPKG